MTASATEMAPHPMRRLTDKTGHTRVAAICGQPCHYGGLSPARKYSRTDLGWMWHCNRTVKTAGERCWQHRDRPTCRRAGEPDASAEHRRDRELNDAQERTPPAPSHSRQRTAYELSPRSRRKQPCATS